MQRIGERSLASGSFRENAIETVRDLGFVSPNRHSEDLPGSFRQNPTFVMPALVAGIHALAPK
jgi:hypothetical protein